MPDGDGIHADENLLDQQSNDLLSFHDIHGLCPAAKSRAKLSQALHQSQISLLIGRRGVHRLEFGLHSAELLAHGIDSLAQLVQRRKAFLVGGQEPFYAFVQPAPFPLPVLLTLLGWIGPLGGFHAASDFCL